MNKIINHWPIIGTIFCGVYSQLVMRWRVGLAGPMPAEMQDKIQFVLSLLLSPWVITAMATTFLGGITWMMAMTRFEISYAYPYISLVYLMVMAGGFMLFNETVTTAKIVGTIFVIVGIIIVSRG